MDLSPLVDETKLEAYLAAQLGDGEGPVRAEKIHALIAERPKSAYEIAQELWGNVAVTQAFLTLSEVIGHLDLLIAEGRARELDEGDVVRFAASGDNGREAAA